MTIIDYKKGGLTESGVGLKLENGILRAQVGYVSDLQFRNFPKMKATGLHFVNCGFESCSKLDFTECDLVECSFRETTEIVADECKFVQCNFSDICTSDFAPLEIWDTKLQRCRFRNIELREENYLCDANPGCQVEECMFEGCWTDRVDLELFLCEESVGGLIKRKKQYNILDDVTERNALQGCNWLQD